jgi:putative phosphoesterase
MSDTHDDLDSIRAAIRIFEEKQISYLIHAGDFIFPGVVDELKNLKDKLPGVRIIGVLGNNDGEKLTLYKKFIEIGAELKAEFDEREFSSSKFGIYHGTNEELREAAIRSGIYDVFIHGHTHKRRNEIVEIALRNEVVVKKIQVLNPGTTHKDFPNIDNKIENRPSIIIYRTEDKLYQFINLISNELIEEPLKINRYYI